MFSCLNEQNFSTKKEQPPAVASGLELYVPKELSVCSFGSAKDLKQPIFPCSCPRPKFELLAKL